MNRIAFILIAFITINLNALNSIGFKTGICQANQTWTYKTANLKNVYDYKTGLYSAISLEFFNHENFELITDIAYCRKGYRRVLFLTYGDNLNGPPEKYILAYNYDFLVINPMIKMKVENSKWTKYALGGIRMDYLLSLPPIDKPYKELFKPTFGVNLGVGLEYSLNSIGINSEIHYQHDLTNLVDTEPSANNTGLRVYNRAFILSLGMKYYFQK